MLFILTSSKTRILIKKYLININCKLQNVPQCSITNTTHTYSGESSTWWDVEKFIQIVGRNNLSGVIMQQCSLAAAAAADFVGKPAIADFPTSLRVVLP